MTGLPQLQIAVDRQATARVGLAPGDVIRAISVGLVGQEGAQVWSGQRRFDLVVRLRDDRRNSLEAIRTLLIDGHDGTKIPLGPAGGDHADLRARPRSAAKPAPGGSRSRRR